MIVSTNGIDNLGFSPAIASLGSAGLKQADSARESDAAALNVNWFSALHTASAPIHASSHSTGFGDVDSLAHAILGKLGTPD